MCGGGGSPPIPKTVDPDDPRIAAARARSMGILRRGRGIAGTLIGRSAEFASGEGIAGRGRSLVGTEQNAPIQPFTEERQAYYDERRRQVRAVSRGFGHVSGGF